MKKGIKTYIYGLYKDNKIIYVGKSRTPYDRQIYHNQNHKFDYCKILDKFNDREIYWINKFYLEGETLLNKQSHEPFSEQWEIGDIVYFKATKLDEENI